MKSVCLRARRYWVLPTDKSLLKLFSVLIVPGLCPGIFFAPRPRLRPAPVCALPPVAALTNEADLKLT